MTDTPQSDKPMNDKQKAFKLGWDSATHNLHIDMRTLRRRSTIQMCVIGVLLGLIISMLLWR